MSNKEDGGAAFPHSFTHESIGDCSGMTLRDYFADKAMNGMLQNPNIRNNDKSISDAEAIAAASYIMADAMLKERNK